MRNEYRITEEFMISWWREFHFVGINIFLTVLLGILGIDCLMIIVSCVLLRNFNDINFYLVILAFLFVVYKIFFSRYALS